MQLGYALIKINETSEMTKINQDDADALAKTKLEEEEAAKKKKTKKVSKG